MQAYHNDPSIKAALIAQLEAHAAADEIIKGQYWEGGKGCAVGCTVHSGQHSEYEVRYGIPEVIARLEDAIFEGLPNGEAKAFPLQFARAIEPGADLSLVRHEYAAWLLSRDGPMRSVAGADWSVIGRVRELHERALRGDVPGHQEWAAARAAAWDAARAAARAAAGDAAWAAARAAAGAAAWDAARASAGDAARAAARAAAGDAAWAAARAAAGDAAYREQRDKLLDLLSIAPIVAGAGT